MMSRLGERTPAPLTVPERQERLSSVRSTQPIATRGSLYIPQRDAVHQISPQAETKIEQKLDTEFKAITDYYRILEAAYEQIAVEVAAQEAVIEAPVEVLAEMPTASGKEKLALLLPAHNEELIIEATINSAVAAGQAIEHIYVVNDNSSDNTRHIATRLLGKANVLNVKRSGKALAVKKATVKFDIIERYEWLHVADADSIFSQNYFRVFRKKLNTEKYAVALGFVQSLRGNWISSYRALTYTKSQQFDRRIQSALGMISVFPGAVTCLRTDIIEKLSFEGPSLTEDFDITLQVHRKKLGNILYIPQAVNYTQDPQNLRDFCNQNLRWMRGFFQGVKKYGVGLHGQKVDAYLGLQMFLTAFFLVQVFVITPLLIFSTANGWLIVLYMLAIDFIINFGVALGSSVLAKRWNLIGVMPYFYFLRSIEIGITVIAFFEVFFQHKFNDDKAIGWSTAGRRYKVSASALADVAH